MSNLQQNNFSDIKSKLDLFFSKSSEYLSLTLEQEKEFAKNMLSGLMLNILNSASEVSGQEKVKALIEKLSQTSDEETLQDDFSELVSNLIKSPDGIKLVQQNLTNFYNTVVKASLAGLSTDQQVELKSLIIID